MAHYDGMREVHEREDRSKPQDPAEYAAQELEDCYWIKRGTTAKAETEKIIREAYAEQAAELKARKQDYLTNERQRSHLANVEIPRLQQWVNDLQSDMFINCVYCGHRYGPREDTPVAMADVLKAHIEKCPEHPLSHSRAELEALREKLPKTADGVPVMPGMVVHFHNSTATVRKVCDGGEYGYTVETEDVDGPQGWVPLRDCYSTREAAEAERNSAE